MALVYCNRHGETGGNSYISKNLQQAVLGGEKIDYVKLKVSFYDEGTLFDSIDYFFVKNELPSAFIGSDIFNVYDESDESYIDSILFPLLEGGGICNKCFKEWLSEQGFSSSKDV